VLRDLSDASLSKILARRAFVGGVDGYFQRPDSATDRLNPEATSLSGWTGSLTLNRNAGNFQVNAALWATSPGFESNDLGFNFRSDRWGGHVVATLRKTQPDSLTRRRQLSVAKWYALNFDGDRQGDGMHVFGSPARG
jgi:hypothetical protein